MGDRLELWAVSLWVPYEGVYSLWVFATEACAQVKAAELAGDPALGHLVVQLTGPCPLGADFLDEEAPAAVVRG